MANRSCDALITLHFYFPTMHGLEVFDLAARRAAIVSDDRGAWWSEAQQLVQCRSLKVTAAAAKRAREEETLLATRTVGAR
jgi:hypothetical protein